MAFLGSSAFAQHDFKGVVLDSLTKRRIEGVHVLVSKNYARTTDAQGQFTIKVGQEFKGELVFSHAAYETKVVHLDMQSPDNMHVELTPKVVLVDEFKLTSNQNNFQDNVSGMHRLSGAELTQQPVLMGEQDIMRAVIALPGVQSVNEGVAGLMVRGGAAGQNAFEFDGIELLNPYHLIGTFSTFNPILTESVDIYKGSTPVHLSSKLSSSIIVKTKNKADSLSKVNLNIGTLSSNLTIQGASANNRFYYSLGMRRTILELYKGLSEYIIPEKHSFFANTSYLFYDVNGKLNYRFSKGLLSLSFYKGKDQFETSDLTGNFQADIEWGNQGATLNYFHAHNALFTSSHSLSYNDYGFSYKGDVLFRDVLFKSEYQRYNLKNSFNLIKNNHDIRFGSDLSFYSSTPQFLSLGIESSSNTMNVDDRNSSIQLFVGDTYKLSSCFSIYAGAKMELFSQFGPYDYFGANENEPNVNRGNWEHVKSYVTISPVVHSTYLINDVSALKASYSHSFQNFHLGGIATIPLPADIWLPSSRLIKPESCHQLTAGYSMKNSDHQIEASLEVYGRHYLNQLIFIPNLIASETANFEDHLSKGIAQSAGFELLIKKAFPRGNAQIAYTYSKARSKYLDLNNKDWFDSKYDRPHDLNITLSYDLSSRISASANWVFASGNKTTLPEQAYWRMGYLMMHNGEINNFRYPAYHRLDLGVDFELKTKRFKSSILNFSIVNVYNRSNPYFLFFQSFLNESKYQIDIKATQVSLFPILPSISWRIKF